MALDREQEAINKFKEYVLSLNEQFARWVVSQWDTKPDRFWCTGMVDYLRHAVIIKRDHAEAVAALGALLQNCPGTRCMAAWPTRRQGVPPGCW